MSELVEGTREKINEMVAELKDDNDFMPFMLVNGAKSKVYVALDMPEWGAPRDAVADVMMGLLVIHRATEAVFASVAWSLWDLTPEERRAWGNRSFEEHPQRREMVFMVHVGVVGEDSFHCAMVTRANGRVTLGEWEDRIEEGTTKAGGRFADAMHMGIKMGQDMPVEMCQYIDEALEAGDDDQVIRPLLNALRRVRAGDFTDEELAEAQRIVAEKRANE